MARLVTTHLGQRARLVINAGTKSERVTDSGWGGHSVFTGALLASPVLRDGFGSALDLFAYLSKTVSAHAAQTPTVGFLPAHEGGDVFIALRRRSWAPPTPHPSPSGSSGGHLGDAEPPLVKEPPLRGGGSGGADTGG